MARSPRRFKSPKVERLVLATALDMARFKYSELGRGRLKACGLRCFKRYASNSCALSVRDITNIFCAIMKKKMKRAAADPHAPSGIHGGHDLIAVGVGASAGGLEAFSELLSHLPAKTGMAYVLVQHMDPHHQSLLAELLSAKARMPVIEV